MSDEKKLKSIFDFLQENRCYNLEFQKSYYRSVIVPSQPVEDRVIALLISTYNTQSRPKINDFASFLAKIHENKSELISLSSFAQFVYKNTGAEFCDSTPYKCLFDGLRVQKKGWGEKVSALFAKSVFQIHSKEEYESFRFWNDVPTCIQEPDKLYLPVDNVIKHIFGELGLGKSFGKVNKLLDKHRCGEYPASVEIWDDLWFWGHFTQWGSGDNRITCWNPSKYWVSPHTDKNPETMTEVERLAKVFIKLL